MERQRRANNPENHDAQGRIKKGGKRHLSWKHSQRYLATRRRKATRERRLAAQRKSLHGRLVHEIVAVGTTVITEKISYRAWQKQFGKSVGLRAPGMFIALLRRTVASTGGTLVEVPTRTTKLSQFCHGCGQFVAKPLWQRWHQCPCGVSAQRDLYSAFLAAYLDPPDFLPSCARQRYAAGWEGREPPLKGGGTARPAPTHTSKLFNARVRGSLCLAASVSPETEHVCPKVQAERHKSPPARKCDGKRGSKARNLQGFSPERSQCAFYCILRSIPIKRIQALIRLLLHLGRDVAVIGQGELFGMMPGGRTDQ
jgi:hypothetical protein